VTSTYHVELADQILLLPVLAKHQSLHVLRRLARPASWIITDKTSIHVCRLIPMRTITNKGYAPMRRSANIGDEAREACRGAKIHIRHIIVAVVARCSAVARHNKSWLLENSADITWVAEIHIIEKQPDFAYRRDLRRRYVAAIPQTRSTGKERTW
jgi:hypothetical protein